MKKALLSIFFLVIVAIGAGIYFVTSSLDGLIKDQVELHGSQALKTQVSVGGVSIKLLDGFGEISDFTIQNPEGYSDNNAFSFKSIRLDIDTNNLDKMPIVIEEITIDSLAALVESDKNASSNINKLLDNVKNNSGSSASKADRQPDSDTGESSDIRITIKQLTVKDTTLALDLTALGDKKYEDTLPTLTLQNIGGSAGVPPAQLGTEIANALLKKIKQEATAKQRDKLKDKAVEKLKEKASGKLKGLLDRM